MRSTRASSSRTATTSVAESANAARGRRRSGAPRGAAAAAGADEPPASAAPSKDVRIRAGDTRAERARKLKQRMARDYDAEAAGADRPRQVMKRWDGPKTGLALGRRYDMEMGADLEELRQKDSVFEDYYREGKLPGFDGNIRDLTKKIYNDPDDPNPRRLTIDTYPLTSYDKRQGRGRPAGAPAPAAQAPRSTGYYNSPPSPESAERRRADIESYDRLKLELQYMTGAAGLIMTPLICTFYSLDAGASYALGASGAMVYVRALSKFSDSLPAPGSQSPQAGPADAVGGAVGSQRLLIPILLILICNRFNKLYADDLNLHLQILTAVAGFFTYKASAIVQAFRDIGLIKR